MNTPKSYELKPTNSQKSFYSKAIVTTLGSKSWLTSYKTIVAEYNQETDTIKLNGYYSPTTAKHIRAFCSMFTDKYISKIDMEEQLTINC